MLSCGLLYIYQQLSSNISISNRNSKVNIETTYIVMVKLGLFLGVCLLSALMVQQLSSAESDESNEEICNNYYLCYGNICCTNLSCCLFLSSMIVRLNDILTFLCRTLLCTYRHHELPCCLLVWILDCSTTKSISVRQPQGDMQALVP